MTDVKDTKKNARREWMLCWCIQCIHSSALQKKLKFHKAKDVLDAPQCPAGEGITPEGVSGTSWSLRSDSSSSTPFPHAVPTFTCLAPLPLNGDFHVFVSRWRGKAVSWVIHFVSALLLLFISPQGRKRWKVRGEGNYFVSGKTTLM